VLTTERTHLRVHSQNRKGIFRARPPAGRPAKPTALKKKQGTLRKSRLNPKEPRLEVFLPHPPPWLSPCAREFYARLGAIAEIAAVVTKVDGDALGLAAVALEELVEADEIIRNEGAVLKRTTENGEVVYRHPAAIQRADAWRRYRDALHDRQFVVSLEGGGPLGPMPELPEALQAVWHEVVAAVPRGVLCPTDRGKVLGAAGGLVSWRRQAILLALCGPEESTQLVSVREAYRVLGQLLMPMRARRQLLFPNRPPRRELA